MVQAPPPARSGPRRLRTRSTTGTHTHLDEVNPARDRVAEQLDELARHVAAAVVRAVRRVGVDRVPRRRRHVLQQVLLVLLLRERGARGRVVVVLDIDVVLVVVARLVVEVFVERHLAFVLRDLVEPRQSLVVVHARATAAMQFLMFQTVNN